MWQCNWGEMFGAGGWPSWHMGGGLFGLLLTILLVTGLIYVISLVVRDFRPGGSSRTDRNDSLAIVRERLAKGDITSEEYERIKDILSL